MGMTMESFTEILEDELAHSFEVKDKNALHRSVLLLAEHVVSKEKHSAEFQLLHTDLTEVKSDVKVMAETMKKGFESMDKRFEAVDKRFGDVNHRFEDVNRRFEDVNQRFEDVNQRFEDVNKRFTIMTSFMSIGFITLGVLVTLYQFLG
jgi:septation ring formation regulator EzrA